MSLTDDRLIQKPCTPKQFRQDAPGKEHEDVNESQTALPSQPRVQIGNTPTRPPGRLPPRILELRNAADGPRLESVEVEIVDWNGPDDPENPLVLYCSRSGVVAC